MNKIYPADRYVAWLKAQAAARRPYWYGTTYVPCTEALLRSKSKQYPSHYGASRMARYRADIAANQTCGDCVGGAIKGAAWSELGAHKAQYASNGVPDTSADGMFAFCKRQGADWGAISTLPERPGVALRRSGHVGVYIGGGQAVEWRGFNYGCVITRLRDRDWTHWYELPWVDYAATPGNGSDNGSNATPGTGSTPALLGQRLLKRGCTGEDVRQLQQALMSLGYDLPRYGADGSFGGETEAALRAMQTASSIAPDGQYGDGSHAALMSQLAESAEDDAPAVPASRKIRITGGSVYVRAGAGTNHRILTVAHRGDVLPCTARADSGWYAVQLSDGDGWVSARYAEVIA